MITTEPKLLLKLWIPSYKTVKKVKGVQVEAMLSVIPSWNELLGMQHWAREKRKKEIQLAILSALSPSGRGSSTRTISARNTCAIFYDTAARYLVTRRESAKSKQRSARLKKAKKSTPK